MAHDVLSAIDRGLAGLDTRVEQVKPRKGTKPAEKNEWPEDLDAKAFHGLAGEIAKLIEPHTEADTAAVLAQILVATGAVIGRGPHIRVEGDQHHGNLFALLVGSTSKARKGTSWGRVRNFFSTLPQWPRVVEGLSSGEGLKFAVRDATWKIEKDKKTGFANEVETDFGVSDKRLLVIESEFAQVLRQCDRPGNTLSATIRSGWDSGNLQTLTKNDPITATGAHISIIGHITSEELRAELTATDRANGFANRFIFMAAKRSKRLPFGGEDISNAKKQDFINRMGAAINFAHSLRDVGMTKAARTAWANAYPALSEGHPGLWGAVTARAEAQALRLALIYALLDSRAEIDLPHLHAAFAVWERSEMSARWIFGSALGDRIADELLRALRIRQKGMTRTEISHHFKKNETAERIGAALNLLRERGLAVEFRDEGKGGRPSEIWTAT